jgi:hypothetical protein
MRRLSLLALLVGLLACATTQETPRRRTGFIGGTDGGWPTDFVADPSTKMTVEAWYAFQDELKERPGSVVNDTGPMVTSIHIDTADEDAMYLFTQLAHPAHPAFIGSMLRSSDTEVTLIVGYAGSESELEAFVRTFLEHMRRADSETRTK